MAEQISSDEGFPNSARRLRDTALNILENRLQILEIEIKEEKQRARALFYSTVILLVTGLMAVVMVSFLLVVAFWDYAIWVLIALTIIYVISSLTALHVIRKNLKPPPFPETVSQIKKDRQWLSSKKH